jgi:glycosyltransferase involved in cell wall biosynthesis
MIRVLYISSTLKRTGPTNILYNLIAELDRNNFEPIILTLSEEDARFPSLWSAFEDLNVKIFSFKFSRLKSFFEGKKKIKDFIEKQKIDVVHIYGFRGDVLVNANIAKHVNVISTINSNIYDDYTMLYGKYLGKVMAYLHIKSLRDKIGIACSRFVAEELNKKYNIDLKVIYNGIPCNDYTLTLPSERDSLRSELLLPLDKKIFIFVGYLIYRKDPITVIKAFLNSKVAEDSILLMIGDGPLMEECVKISKGRKERIMFLGNQPSTLNFLKASDFYISSAYSEGLPTSVMEAMGCGLPVILSNIKPHEELVSNIGNFNYLFPVNDFEILSIKMDEIIRDEYSSLSQSSRNVIVNDINSNIMSSNYQLLYETKK